MEIKYGLSNGTSVNYLKWPWRSFASCSLFQVQSVEHLYSILLDFNCQRACPVPQRQLTFLRYSCLNHSKCKMWKFGDTVYVGILSARDCASLSCFLSSLWLKTLTDVVRHQYDVVRRTYPCPSMLQTTFAAASLKKSPHTVPHVAPRRTSRRPWTL